MTYCLNGFWTLSGYPCQTLTSIFVSKGATASLIMWRKNTDEKRYRKSSPLVRWRQKRWCVMSRAFKVNRMVLLIKSPNSSPKPQVFRWLKRLKPNRSSKICLTILTIWIMKMPMRFGKWRYGSKGLPVVLVNMPGAYLSRRLKSPIIAPSIVMKRVIPSVSLIKTTWKQLAW